MIPNVCQFLRRSHISQMSKGLLRIRSYPSQRAGQVDQVVQGDCDGSAATTGWTFSEGTVLGSLWFTYPLCHSLVAFLDKGRLQVDSKIIARQSPQITQRIEHHGTPIKC